MLFMFYILVFLNINYANIECFTLRNNELDANIHKTNSSKATNTADLIRNNATTRYFFKMIQNLTSTKTKRSNLKSHVFDKMLSDEMLSIKKHIFEKDLSSQVSIMISTNADASTPTIEIKQKWPIEEYELVEYNENKFADEVNDDSKFENKMYENNTTIDNETKTTESEQPRQNIDKKIVGLRSLSVEAHPHGPFHRKSFRTQFNNISHVNGVTKGANLQNLCTCTKFYNPSAPHSFHGSNSQCRCANISKACTRITPMTIATVPIVPYYVTYQTLLLEISTYSPYRDYYYHPNVIDDIKISKKHKRRKHKHKTTRLDEDSLYYDNSKEGFFKGYDSKSEEDSSGETDAKNQHKDDNKFVIDIDYEFRRVKEQSIKTTIQWENAYLRDVQKDKLVNDVVKDLKKQYADSVLRECYCSAFSFQRNFTHCHLFLAFIIFFYYFAY